MWRVTSLQMADVDCVEGLSVVTVGCSRHTMILGAISGTMRFGNCPFQLKPPYCET